MKRILALVIVCLLVIPMFSVLAPKVQAVESVSDGLEKSLESAFSSLTSYLQQNDPNAAAGSGKSPQAITLSGAGRRDSASMSVVDSLNLESSSVVTPFGMDGLYIGYARTDDYANYPNEQFDFGTTIGIWVDVDNSWSGTRYIDIFVYLRTPNQDIIDGDSVYNIAVTGTGDSDAQYLSMYNGYDYMQYAGTKWHILIIVRDHYTLKSFDQMVFITIGPIFKDHFTCKDPYNAYATKTTTFYDTETAWEYTAWDTHNLWITYEVKWDFNGPGTSHLIAGPEDLPPGQSNFWAAGGITGGAAGSWYVDVLLNDVFRARDGFDIIPPVLPTLDVSLVSPSNGATVGSPVELRARVTSSGSSVQDALVRFYVDSNPSGTGYSDSSGYAFVSHSPSIGTHNWYVTAEKSGYTSGTSPTWSFSYGGPPDFAILAEPDTISIQAGTSGTVTVNVDSLNGFQSSVTLGVSNLPSGVTYSYDHPTVTPPVNGRTSSVLTLTVSSTTSSGTYYPKVTGTCISPSTYHEYPIDLTITEAPPPQYTVLLRSKTTDGLENIGTIVFSGIPYSIPNSLSKIATTYDILAIPPGSYSFHHWETTGGVSISESEKYSIDAQLSVSGNGELIAVFYYDIRLVFSTDETYYPVKGLSYDGNDNIEDNYANYNPSTYQLPDLDGDGAQDDAPAYLYKSFDGTYMVFEYWIYYAYDDKKLAGVLPFWNHEHDFESIYLRIDSSYYIIGLSISQHDWVNNYWSAIPRTIFVGVEKGGHGMLMLDSSFNTKKPDNTDLKPGLEGTFNSNSKIGCLYPWSTYTGSALSDGFGDTRVTKTSYWEFGPTPFYGTAHLDASIIYPLISIEWLSIGGNILDSVTNSMLLKSSHPVTVSTVMGLLIVVLQFHIKAPWVRRDFINSALRWVTIGYSGFVVKKCAFFIVNWVSLGLKSLLAKIVIGSVKFVLNGLPNFLGIINDPTQIAIMDESGNVLGYRDGELVNEIPGGAILTKESTYEIYFIFNNNTALDQMLRCFTPETYNFTITASYFNETSPMQWFNATNIPLGAASQHIYSIDWLGLLIGQNATEVNIDQDGDGVFEHEFMCGSELTGEEIEQAIAHDISLVSILLPKNVIAKGCSLSIDVTIKNQGSYSEDFIITVFADKDFTVIGDEITIGTNIVHSMENGTSIIVTLAWNTSALAMGRYVISAVVDTVPGEIDTSDNNFTGFWVTVTILGDVDGNFEVDIYDVTAICVCYDSKIGDPMYYANCDIDGNGIIDIFDVTAACIAYGQKYP